MLQPPTAPLAGPRPPRAPRSNKRGGIQKRPGGAVRVDKDGDLDMESAGGSAKDRGAGHGGQGASQSRGNTGSGLGSSRDAKNARLRRGIDPMVLQTTLLRRMGIDGNIPRGIGPNSRAKKQLGKSLVRERDLNARVRWEQIIIRGFQNSKAASNPDGGIKDLVAFLERKASAPHASAKDLVRVKQVCLTLCFPGHR